jgi:hypothetical protein
MKGLIVLDQDGEPSGDIDRPKVESTFGCSLTASGNLLVYDNGSRSVLQYGDNDKFVGKIIKPTHTYENRRASQLTMCCNKQMTKMILAGANDNIEVYNVS